MLNIFEKIDKYYESLIKRYGHDPKACDYGVSASQTIKFRVISEVADLSGCKILDVGCGFADFAEYLEKKVGNIHYTGIDICEAMILKARQIRPHLELLHLNILDQQFKRKFDYVSANGIFYLLGSQAKDLMLSIVEKMFNLAECGIAFNSLSSWAPKKESDEFYADPLKTAEFCHAMTPNIVLRHDYHPRDFTIYMYKKAYYDRIN